MKKLAFNTGKFRTPVEIVYQVLQVLDFGDSFMRMVFFENL